MTRLNCLVTGGAGFIGSHLVERLCRDGHAVTVMLKPGESTRNIEGMEVRTITCDLLDRRAMLATCESIDVVFHLAARTDLDGRTLADYDANVQGTRHLLESAERHGVKRLVFFSSMLAVPLTGTRDPIDEHFDLEPANLYGLSKREGERIIAAGAVPWTIIRPTLVFGPRERSTMRAFFRAVNRRQFMPIGADVLQSFVYVGNLVEATYIAATHPDASRQIFFISDECPYTLAAFAGAAADALGTRLLPIRLPKVLAYLVAYGLSACQRLFGISVPLTPSRVRTMTTHYVYNVEKARRLLGYREIFGLGAAMRETAAWYEQHRLL